LKASGSSIAFAWLLLPGVGMEAPFYDPVAQQATLRIFPPAPFVRKIIPTPRLGRLGRPVVPIGDSGIGVGAGQYDERLEAKDG
jgi:hypothetical protein